MATNRDLLNQKFGNPVTNPKEFEKNNMVVWNCKEEFPELPFEKMYINYYILPFLRITYKALQAKGLLHEITSFGGCWAIRMIRGYDNILSIHSWALAVDYNVEDNQLGKSYDQLVKEGKKPFSEAFIQVWRDTGWVAGADFNRKDRMHFQYTKPFDH